MYIPALPDISPIRTHLGDIPDPQIYFSPHAPSLVARIVPARARAIVARSTHAARADNITQQNEDVARAGNMRAVPMGLGAPLLVLLGLLPASLAQPIGAPCARDTDCASMLCPTYGEVPVCSQTMTAAGVESLECECGAVAAPPAPPKPGGFDPRTECGGSTKWCPGTSFCIPSGMKCPTSSGGIDSALMPTGADSANAAACLICVENLGYYGEDGSCSMTQMGHVARQCFDNGRGATAECCNSLTTQPDAASQQIAPSQSCPPGAYIDRANGNTCQPCPAGTFQPLVGATACVACPAGKFTEVAGEPVRRIILFEFPSFKYARRRQS